MHYAASGILGLNSQLHWASSGQYKAVVKIIDFPAMFQHKAELKEKIRECRSGKRNKKESPTSTKYEVAVAAKELERTRWPTLLRDYKIKSFALDKQIDGVGRGRLLGEGGFVF